jgi:hypothetical protein
MTTTKLRKMPEIKPETWNTSNSIEILKISGLNFQTAAELQVKYHSKKIMNLDTHHSMLHGPLARPDQLPCEKNCL